LTKTETEIEIGPWARSSPFRTPTDRFQIEKILRGQLGDKLFVKRYKDAVHGFAVRGDDQQPRERGFKEDAANEGIKFAQKWVSNPTSMSSAGV
jgi:hypothetical protein